MKWVKPTLLAFAVLLAIAAALPFLVPLGRYIPQIEKEASARLGEPVSIKSMALAALPSPHLTLEGITVGTTGDIRLGKVTVTPDLFSMLRSPRIIKRIEIDSLALTRKAIDRIPALARQDAAGPAPQFLVGSIRLNGALLSLGDTTFGPFDARVNLDGKGEPGEASIATQDGKFKALLTPDQANYRIDASATSWTLPVAPAIAFDALSIKGVATLHGADLSEVSAKLYGGTATGNLTVHWEKGLQLAGKLEVSQVETQQLAALLSPGARVSGKLDAKPVFSASAASVDQLMNALQLETPFSVQHGVLHGVDIQQAATSLIKQGTGTGETRFEQLSGHLVMQHGAYRFTQLRIASGALSAEGDVNVSPKRELSGRIVAQVKVMGAGTSVPLNVAGTVDAPSLYPTGGTMAGAAVGTAILGPGLGTSVGAKAGAWVEGLFGKDPDKKPVK